MELLEKSSPDKKGKIAKAKESSRKSSYYRVASCSSFLTLIILSSLVSLALAVLYMEVYHVEDNLILNDSNQKLALELEQPIQAVKDTDESKYEVELNVKPNVKKLPEEKRREDLETTEINIDNKILEEADDVTNRLPEQEDKQADSVKTEKFVDISKPVESHDQANFSKSIKENYTNDGILQNNKKSKHLDDQDKPKENVQPEKKIEQVNIVEEPKLISIEKQIEVNKDKDELLKLYMEVEELTDEILSQDPKNDMVMQLAPHLEATLKDIELDRIAGIKDGLIHIRSILIDLKARIFESKDKKEQPLPENPSSDDKISDNDGKLPVDEVIPDPVYITPLEADTATKNNPEMPTVAKKEKEAPKQQNEGVLMEKLLEDLKQESAKNSAEAIKKMDESLLKYPNNVDILLLKAVTLDTLSSKEKSNPILEQTIDTYKSIVNLAVKDVSSVPKDTLRMVGLACAEKMLFRGFQHKAVKLLQQMIRFFPEDVAIKNKLGVAFLTFNEVHSAKNIFADSLKLNPDDGFAQVHYGFILKSEGIKLKEAVKFLQSGIASEAEGTSDGRFYFHLGDALQRLNESESARKVYQAGVKNGLFLNEWQRSLYNVDRLSSRPIWTLEETTYEQFFKKLENNWKKIKLEGFAALSLTDGLGFKPEAENLKDTGDWKQFELFARGKKDAKNCAKTPITCGLIEEFSPAAGCKRGQVKFSVMEPGTHIWPHTGPSNCRLRAHLGLVVPDGLEMRVADKAVTWQEGKIIIFDDSWEHEVWHRGTSPRLILIVDVWHPELSYSERKSLSAI